MQLTHTDEVAVWFANGVPARLVWRGERFRVNDRPTRLEDELGWHPAITHPPSVVGWRFQARGEAGRSLVFDVQQTARGWVLLRTYE